MTPYTPAPIVEVAFGFGPFDEPTGSDWVDVTDDVYEVNVQRGRDSEFDSFPASTATVCLYNDDRTYDPLNLAGPYVESVPDGTVPFVVALNTKSGTSLGSNNSMNMPSGIVAGELLVAIVSENLGGTAITADAAWTQVRQQQHNLGGTGVRMATFAKIAVGSDTLSLSGGTEDFACAVLRVANHGVTTISTDILSGHTSSTGVGSGSGADYPTATATEARPYLGLFSGGFDGSNSASPFSDTGFTDVVGVISAPSTSTTLFVSSGTIFHKDAPKLAFPGGTYDFAIASGTFSVIAIALLIPGPTEPRTQLQPNTPIRIMADLASDGVFPVWRGVVDAWPGTYSEGGFRNEVEVSCTDVFKVLAERVLPDTLLADVATALGYPTTPLYTPYAWFRGDLSPFGQLVDHQGHSKNGMMVTPVTIGESINNGISPKSLEFSPGQAGVTNRNVEFPVPDFTVDDLLRGTSWAWSALVRADGAAATSASIRLVATTATTDEVLIYVNVSDIGVVTAFFNGVGANVTATPAPGVSSSDRSVNLLDGKLHHVFVLRTVTSLAIWVDGVVLTSASNGSATSSFNTNGARISTGKTTGGTPGFSMSEVMFWKETVFSTALIPTLYSALTVGFGTPRLSGEVINDVLDLIEWPASLRAIDDGEQIVAPPGNPGGLTVLDVLQKVAETEQGRLFVDAEGLITFHSRNRVISETTENTVQYTFSDSGTDVGTLDGSLQVSLDDRFVYDSAKVTRENGSEQTASAVNKPSRTRSIDGLYLTDDNQALAIAEWIVFRYGTPLVRTSAWEIDCEVKPEDWADILSLDIGHRIEHDVTPGGIGSSLELEQHVDLIEHEITPERWLITMNGVPVDDSRYFLWDTTETTDLAHGWDIGAWG